MPVEPASVPDFDHLPQVKGMPQGCAWGIFDQRGKKDLVGTLNFLTPTVIKAAVAEVTDGVSISLNWPLNAISKVEPLCRTQPKHNVKYLPETMKGVVGKSWDDELEFNTQDSSQWDSLCHIHHLPSGLVYNGFSPDKQSLAAKSTVENKLPTLDHWHPHGGLVGRGVLLDYKAFAEETGVPFSPLDGISIKVKDLESCAKFFGVEFRPGDVLTIRTGTTDALENQAKEDMKRLASGRMSGLDGSEEMARWLWNKRFAAVASDTFALEAFTSVKPDGTLGELDNLVLHHYLLGLFGMPIGELWDLKNLSEYCKKTKRYSFLVTSAPLNHPCLVGSPANALAIL
ncbi:putative cyclase domain-containing protein [Hirsutella rhossiliensis]|uniref:Cyclase domain-containing protein n=1 Tax=Hirsutella rhossiliensis TaxID=111463 RepID=A0A9P8N088_9HYPO|nr:putative cyclase domain-containing protein [Hirsutella rhossiliensis]KAH0962367.1 putative cyclase domain-containing protein [Hirsutella rhossiliensis]